MNENIIIKKATKKDFSKIAEIYAESYNDTPYKEKWTNKTALARIKHYNQFCDIFVAELDKKIIGLTIIDEEDWYDGKWIRLWEIVVKKEFRNRGFGKHIISFIEKYSAKRGIKKIIMESYKKSNAYKIYNKLNYKDNGWAGLIKNLK